MKRLTFILFITLQSLFLSSISTAQVAVIVNLKNDASINVNQIDRLFLKKEMSFSNGVRAEPFDAGDESLRSNFYKSISNKSLSQLKAYWARMIFSGKQTPPEVLGNASEIKRVVASRPNAIAYIDSSEVDSSVRVVLTID